MAASVSKVKKTQRNTFLSSLDKNRRRERERERERERDRENQFLAA